MRRRGARLVGRLRDRDRRGARLLRRRRPEGGWRRQGGRAAEPGGGQPYRTGLLAPARKALRSEEHTSELQSLMRSSYAVFCLKKKTKTDKETTKTQTSRTRVTRYKLKKQQ